MLTIENIHKLIGVTLDNGFQIQSIDADMSIYKFNVERIERLFTTQRVIETNVHLARMADKGQRYIISAGGGRILWINLENIKNISAFKDTLSELLNQK
jgi:shikimate kinase